MSKTVKVDLRRSYRYADPETGEEKMYGPGEGVSVPQGLADALLLSPATEDEKPVAAPEPEPGAAGAEESGTRPRRASAKKSSRTSE